MNRSLCYVLASIAGLASACSNTPNEADAGGTTTSASASGSTGGTSSISSTGASGTTTSATSGSSSSASGGSGTSAGASTGSGTTGSGTSSSTTGIGSTTQRHLTSTGGGTGAGSSTTGGTNGGAPVVGSDGESPFTIGGQVYGLSTGTLKLQNNGADTLTINSGTGAAQDFSFATALPDLTAFDVTILSSPAGLTCSLVNGSGTIQSSSVVGVEIDCCPSCPATDAGAGTCTRVNGVPLNPFPTTFSSAEADGCGSPGCYSAPLWDANTGLLQMTYYYAYEQQTLVWQNATQTMDDFTVQFSFEAFNYGCDQTTPNDADGFGFFITPTPPAIANLLPAIVTSSNFYDVPSGSVGMNGLGGVGFEFDLYNNNDCSDSTSYHVGLDLLSGACGATNNTPTTIAQSGDLTTELPGVFGKSYDECGGSTYPTMADKVVHAVSISVAGDKVTAFTIDGTTVTEMIGADLTNGGSGGLVPGAQVYFGLAGASPAAFSCDSNFNCTQYGDQIEMGNLAITVPVPFCH